VTAPAGRVRLEAGVEYISGEPDFLTGRERERWDLPVLRLVWSPAGNVELDLEWTGRVAARGEAGGADVADWGDVVLRAKVAFADARRGRTALGARFWVALPQTSFGSGLGPNTLRFAAQALATRSLGGWTVHANAGLMIHDEVLRPHEQRDFLAYGLALERRLAGSAAMVAEVAGRAGDGMPGAEERAELRAGFRFGGRRSVDVALRRGLAGADGTWGVTFGVSWTLRERAPTVRRAPGSMPSGPGGSPRSVK
jgi:hypothetical protein